MSRCIVVVPTYNEAENLPLLVPQVLEQSPELEVLVVDDNSPDGTGKIADGDRLGLDPWQMRSLPRSMGYGCKGVKL